MISSCRYKPDKQAQRRDTLSNTQSKLEISRHTSSLRDAKLRDDRQGIVTLGRNVEKEIMTREPRWKMSKPLRNVRNLEIILTYMYNM